jgi:uncharacterized protein (DUF58 family)
MFVFGRLAGMRELLMAGSAIGLVLVIGAVIVMARRGSVEVQRSVVPARTVAGHRVRVQLTVRATGKLGTGPVLLSDRIPKRIGEPARLALPAGSRRERSVAYHLTPRLRGRYLIGPMEITHTDPFGAMQRTHRSRGATALTVYPSYEDIAALPTGVHRLGVVRHSPLVGLGDEFYALRPYQEGDDLRKVHWPSSMRAGELVIRQEELLAEPRALIVLDTCANKHTGRGASASIEAAISAAAAIGVLALRRRMRLDILTSDGPLLDSAAPSERQLLEALAILEPSRRRDLTRAADRIAARRPAVTVVITPGLNAGELHAVALLSRGTAGGAVVEIDAASFTSGGSRKRGGRLSALALPVVTLRSGDSFRAIWQGALRHAALAR